MNLHEKGPAARGDRSTAGQSDAACAEHEDNRSWDVKLSPALLRKFLFGVRADMYVERRPQKIFSKVEAPLTDEVLAAHLSGKKPIHVYLMEPGSGHTHNAIIDIDDHDGAAGWDRVVEVGKLLISVLERFGLNALPFRSSGGQGIHLWMKWRKPQKAQDARYALGLAIAACGLSIGDRGVTSRQVEVFPKQDFVKSNAFGSAIAIPFSPISVALDPVTFEPAQRLTPRLSEDVRAAPPEVSGKSKSDWQGPPPSLDVVRDALSKIDGSSYYVWMIIGLALKATYPDAIGRELWLEFSRTCGGQFDERECLSKWDHGLKHPRSLTIGTVFHYARLGGWTAKIGAEYFARDGKIFWNRPAMGGGTMPVRLCNFEARIIADILKDDGSGEPKRYFIIEGTLGRAEVQADRFDAMQWVTGVWGARAIIEPGEGIKNRLAVAIKELSTNAAQRMVYQHLGWREIGGKWLYLHGNGAIGENGPVEGIDVQPGGALADLALAAPQDIPAAVRASLTLLDVGDIGAALLAAVYRAPLGEFCPTDFSIFVHGNSGSFKSAITGVAQAHFGPHWDGEAFPGNWSSTANALEKQAFAAKDALFVVDDYAPNGKANDIAKLQGTAERLLRSVGNRAGRARMNADTTLKSAMPPRGLVISSGEDIPGGMSLRARMLLIPITRGDIDRQKLTELQDLARTGLLAEAMAAYVQWLAGRAPGLKRQLPRRLHELRSQAAGEHKRTPQNVASLMLGAEQFLDFATERGVLVAAKAMELRGRIWLALNAQAQQQATDISSEDPVHLFIQGLRASILAGRAHVGARKDNGEPPNPHVCGWRNLSGVWREQGDRVGWIDGVDLYLNPGVAYAMAEELLKKQNLSLRIHPGTLAKRLKEADLFLSTDERRCQKSVRVGGATQKCWHLSAARILGEGAEASADNERPF